MTEIDVDIPKKSERMLYRRTSADQGDFGELEFEPFVEKPCFAISKLKPSPPEQRRIYRKHHVDEKQAEQHGNYRMYNEHSYIGKPDLDKDIDSKDSAQSIKMQLRNNLKKLRFDESFIHQWGVFTTQPIPKGEAVIEYIGELIRLRVVDKRQKINEAEGNNGSYIFQPKHDKDECIDATHKGGLARFINHSCDPNCATKAVYFNGSDHLIIYAKRNIDAYEELCYDYQIQYESKDKRIRCLCGSPKCKKWLNWSEEAEKEMNYKYDGQSVRNMKRPMVPEDREATPDPEKSETENFSSQLSESGLDVSSQGSETNLSAKLSRKNSSNELSNQSSENNLVKKSKPGRKKKSAENTEKPTHEDRTEIIYYYFDEEESEDEAASKKGKKRRYTRQKPKTPPREKKSRRVSSKDRFDSSEEKEEEQFDINDENEIAVKEEKPAVLVKKEEKPAVFVKKEDKPAVFVKKEESSATYNQNGNVTIKQETQMSRTALPNVMLYGQQNQSNKSRTIQPTSTFNEQINRLQSQAYPPFSHYANQQLNQPQIQGVNQQPLQIHQNVPQYNQASYLQITQLTPQITPIQPHILQIIQPIQQMNQPTLQTNQPIQYVLVQSTNPASENRNISTNQHYQFQSSYMAQMMNQDQAAPLTTNLAIRTKKFNAMPKAKKDLPQNDN